MKTYIRILGISLLAGAMTLGAQAQGRPGGHGGRSSRASSSMPSRQSSGSQSRSARPAGKSNFTGRGSQMQARPASNTRRSEAVTPPAQRRPASQTRPGGSRSSANNRPGGNQGNMNNRPGNRPGGNQGNMNNRPGNRPGGNQGNMNNRPGNRPGGNHGNMNNRPGKHHGSSVGRPGGWNPVTPPHNNWHRPGYRPPRPGGGYWGPPAPTRYRIGFWAPPRPPRYTYAVVGVPTLGTLLGLTFGSFIDAGINSLYTSGYNVAGYYNNVIYVNNVTQLGMLWPEVTINYTDGLLTNGQFTYYSSVPGMGRFEAAYTQLYALYGLPVAHTANTVTWWAGDNTGYITLHYTYGNSLAGVPGYYTTLTYSAYY